MELNLFKIPMFNKLFSYFVAHAGVVGQIKIKNPLAEGTLVGLIDKLTNALLAISFALAPLLYVYAAFQIMASAGDPKRAQQGWDTVKWTTIGLVVIAIAKSLTALITSILNAA